MDFDSVLVIETPRGVFVDLLQNGVRIGRIYLADRTHAYMLSDAIREQLPVIPSEG